jgi:putative transposase
VESDDILHPGHHSIRAANYDYRSRGIYFVTICSYQRSCIFGRVVGHEVELFPLGCIVRKTWLAIPLHYPHVKLHENVVMPNHIHVLIEIGCRDGAQHAAPLGSAGIRAVRERRVLAGSLGAIVRSFKAAVTKFARTELRYSEEIWQRNYFERVVRDGKEYSETCRYIADDPLKWERDRENPEARRG